jgi:hypothetical protein
MRNWKKRLKGRIDRVLRSGIEQQVEEENENNKEQLRKANCKPVVPYLRISL